MKRTSINFLLLAKAYRGRMPEWEGEPNFRKYGRELDSKPATYLNIIKAAPLE